MKWQNVRRRRKPKKRGRKVEKLRFETILGLVERESFSTLAEVIARKGISKEWRTLDTAHKDTIPMDIFRRYIFDEDDKDSDEMLLSNIGLFFNALFVSPDYNPNEVNGDGDTLLHLFCKTEKGLSFLGCLLNREDININMIDLFGCTPLDICILYQNNQVKQLLVEKGGLTAEEVSKIEQEKKEIKTFASLEEYREMKVNNFYPKTSGIKKLLDPNVLDKKWI